MGDGMNKIAQRYIGGHIPSNIYDRIKAMAEKEQRPVVYFFKKFIEEGLERNDG